MLDKKLLERQTADNSDAYNIIVNVGRLEDNRKGDLGPDFLYIRFNLWVYDAYEPPMVGKKVIAID